MAVSVARGVAVGSGSAVILNCDTREGSGVGIGSEVGIELSVRSFEPHDTVHIASKMHMAANIFFDF